MKLRRSCSVIYLERTIHVRAACEEQTDEADSCLDVVVVQRVVTRSSSVRVSSLRSRDATNWQAPSTSPVHTARKTSLAGAVMTSSSEELSPSNGSRGGGTSVIVLTSP